MIIWQIYQLFTFLPRSIIGGWPGGVTFVLRLGLLLGFVNRFHFCFNWLWCLLFFFRCFVPHVLSNSRDWFGWFSTGFVLGEKIMKSQYQGRGKGGGREVSPLRFLSVSPQWASWSLAWASKTLSPPGWRGSPPPCRPRRWGRTWTWAYTRSPHCWSVLYSTDCRVSPTPRPWQNVCWYLPGWKIDLKTKHRGVQSTCRLVFDQGLKQRGLWSRAPNIGTCGETGVWTTTQCIALW